MEKPKEMDLIPLFHHHNWTLELLLHWGVGGRAVPLHFTAGSTASLSLIRSVLLAVIGWSSEDLVPLWSQLTFGSVHACRIKSSSRF